MNIYRTQSNTKLFKPAIWVLLIASTICIQACSIGPDFIKPTAKSPDDWTTWRSGDASLHESVDMQGTLSKDWWKQFNDPILDKLEERAFEASPDLQTAALHFAQSRIQRSTVAAQRVPEVNLSGDLSRQRQSEYGAGTRMLDAIGGDRSRLAKLLAKPFNLYQAGFDASWELDLWGRIGRSIEAADADISRQAALLEMARLSIASDVAQYYFDVRTAQSQTRLLKSEIKALEDRLSLIEVRANAGIIDHSDLERQRAELSGLRAQLPGLMVQETESMNQITLLLGQQPGALRDELRPLDEESYAQLPDLSLGLPSEVALRRPDIRAAEAQLHKATANIGIAQASLYPSITLGARFGYESYLSGEFADWGSRTWSIGPSLNLPIFDRGRRKSVVELRELEQQEAAVNYQHTVLQAWKEIDDALSGYSADRQQAQELSSRVSASGQAYELIQARYKGGIVDFVNVLDSQRSFLQARRELIVTEGHLRKQFVVVNKAIGNTP